MLWDLATDYYLHHANPRTWSEVRKRSYINWYTPQNLEKRSLPPFRPPKGPAKEKPVSFFDDYWLEYYRPATLSSFLKMFPYKMNSTIKYIPFKSTQEGRYDLSPFRVRNELEGDAQDKKKTKKEVTILDPQELAKAGGDDDDSIMSPKVPGLSKDKETNGTGNTHTRGISLQRWLQPSVQDKNSNGPQSIMKETGMQINGWGEHPKSKPSAIEKSRQAQWTFTQVVHESLNPSVNTQEAEDYTRYVSHPQNLPLVVSAEAPADLEVDAEYEEYLNGNWRSDNLTPIGGEEDYAIYSELLKVGENPLTVTEGDALKKRYKAYGKWLRGKSLFKQQPID